MSTLIFDIETIGEDFDALDEHSQEVLTRWVKRDAKTDEEYEHALETVKNGLGFSPLTGQIVAIGVFDPDRERGVVYYQAPGQDMPDQEENGITYKQRTEADMLRQFWEGCQSYKNFVTFNGRSFDVPFLMIRSAIHSIRPSKNLVAQRYVDRQHPAIRHIDLCDQLSFYGAVWRKPSLHIACRAFGIESPKAHGVTGDEVSGLYRAARHLDIARYNARDLKATAELFRRWYDFLRF